MNILRLSTLSLTFVLFTLGALILPVNTALADHCKGKHKKEPGCSGGDGVSYEIAYNFVVEPSSTGSFDTIVECTSGYCQFSAEHAFDFHLPSLFLSLFTTAEANTCFGTGHTTAPAHVPAHSLFFRSSHGKDQDGWHGHVGVLARTKGDEPVNYTFHFGGPCPGSVCPPLPGLVNPVHFPGELLYVGTPSRGKGKRAAGCTCAWEGCPDNDEIVLTLTEGTEG